MKKKIRKSKRDKDGYEYDFDGVNPKDLVDAKPPDFMPSPAEIARKMKNAKITILVDGEVIGFFKYEAGKNGVSYQKMIREVLRNYMQRMRRAA